MSHGIDQGLRFPHLLAPPRLDRRQIEFLDRLRCTLGERGRNGCQRYKAGGSTRAGAGKMAAHGG